MGNGQIRKKPKKRDIRQKQVFEHYRKTLSASSHKKSDVLSEERARNMYFSLFDGKAEEKRSTAVCSQSASKENSKDFNSAEHQVLEKRIYSFSDVKISIAKSGETTLKEAREGPAAKSVNPNQSPKPKTK